jgi:predicted phage-related endonuclease
MRFIEGNRIHIDPPKRPKKITGTRFATILGLNRWSTPFEVWCEITRTYEKPFEDTIYTTAGKVIEPKIIQYLRDRYFMDIKSPTDVYGEDYFKKTWGDFFHEHKILGGMWDVLGDDFVVEIKTTKRAEDWQNDPPEYYKLQAALYAYLLGYDHVIMTGSFLEDADYEHPEKFVPSVENTILVEFSVSEDYPHFEDNYVIPALHWWHDHVETGISPEFDEKKDAEILKVLRTNYVEATDDSISGLLKESESLQSEIDRKMEEYGINAMSERLKAVLDEIKRYMTDHFRDGDKKVELTSDRMVYTLTKSVRSSVDTTALKKAGLYDQYTKQSVSYTLKTSDKE